MCIAGYCLHFSFNTLATRLDYNFVGPMGLLVVVLELTISNSIRCRLDEMLMFTVYIMNTLQLVDIFQQSAVSENI